MAKANKKQRHEARRKAKKLEARRREAISPVKRLADLSGEVECWMSDGFEQVGQMQIFAYKSAGGMTGVAAFLVDQGVVGLKDAWHNIGIDRAMLDSMMDGVKTGGVKMVRCKLDEARRWVAGAARWAHDNGMRLPKDWLKTATLIGGVGDWKAADVSNFVMEFAGHPEDLRQRLIGQSFESYLAREDVEFTFSDLAPYKNQRTGGHMADEEFDDDAELDDVEIMRESMVKCIDLLAEETSFWLRDQNQTASPELTRAWLAILVAKLSGKQIGDETRGPEVLQMLLEDVHESLREETARAVVQVMRHIQADPDVALRAASRIPSKESDEIDQFLEGSIAEQ